MGLLDDAIREHLELKRRRGADPGEVAREQHEALDPVPRDQHAPGDVGDAPLVDSAPHDAPEAGVMAGSVPEDMPDELADEAFPSTGSAAEVAVGGETEELDMRSVLGDEHDPHGAGAGAVPAPSLGEHAGAQAGAPAPAESAEEDSLEWEVPGESAEETPLEEEEPGEDVLEETPEFLRDTPEQERLWFEQRPPRDFDFDK
jgi:hypothetical protein